MADNIEVTAGSGTNIATDDIGGVHYQRVKLVDGTLDETTAIAAGGGAEAGALRVTIANDSTGVVSVDDGGGALTVDGTVAVTDLATLATAAKQDTAAGILTTIDGDTGSIKTAVELLDNAVDGNYLNTNMNIAGTDVVGGAGAVAAGVQRVTLASDDPAVTDLAALEVLATSIDSDTAAMVADLAAIEVDIAALEVLATSIDADTDAIKTAVETIDNAISGTEMQVDVVASLPAGTNAIGKLAANSGVDIGDVDVLSTSIDKSINGAGAPTIDSYTHAAFNLAAGANQVLVASAANKQIWVYGIGFTTNVAGTVSFQDEDDTAITGIMNIDAKSGMVVSPSGNFAMPIWKLGTDKDLEVDVVTAELDGWVDYAIVSV